MSRNALMAAALVIAAVAVAIAGCSGGSKSNSLLSGADVFNPDNFSMAIYDVALTQGGNVTDMGYIVSTNTTGKDADVLTSITFSGNCSTRADTEINKAHTKTLNVLISDINDSSLEFSGGSPMFNMTTYDQAWNALDTSYGYIGTANVTVPAGNFTDCKVYGSNTTISLNGKYASLQVLYYIAAAEPVPVMFKVVGPDSTYVYSLRHAYASGDTASTPERVTQTFFDDLDNGRLDAAFDCLVTRDEANGTYVTPDAATYQTFIDNMNRTYKTGDDSYRVQYVDVTAVVPVSSLSGNNIYTVQWDSIHYQVGTLSIYRLSGSFYVTEIGGQWRIIV